MGEYSKTVKDIIDQDKYYTNPGPAVASDVLKRKPTDSMLWHLHHKPYDLGGDDHKEI